MKMKPQETEYWKQFFEIPCIQNEYTKCEKTPVLINSNGRHKITKTS